MKYKSTGKVFGFSQHAENRKRQRAINDEAVNYVIGHGFIFHAGHCDTAYWLCRKASGHASPVAGRFANIAVIVTPDGRVKTVMRCSRPPRHWKRAG